jgi:hypothetical protein
MNGKPSSPVLTGLGASDGARLLDNYPGALRHLVWQLTIRGRAVERISQSVWVQGRVPFFATLLTQALPEKLLGKPTLIYTPTHPERWEALRQTVKLTSALFHLWSFMRREIGPFSVSQRGSSLVCAGNCSELQLGGVREYAVPGPRFGGVPTPEENPNSPMVVSTQRSFLVFGGTI